MSVESNKNRNPSRLSSLNSGLRNMLESHIRVAEFSRGWIPFAERGYMRDTCERSKRMMGKVACGEKRARAQKLTRESALCAVSEPEASPYCVSSRVAVVSVFVIPDHFLPLRSPPLRPPPLCSFVSSGSLSRVLLSSGAHSYVKFSTARRDKGELCTILRDAFLSRFSLYLSFSLSLFSQSWRSQEKSWIVVYEFAYSSSPHSVYSNIRHCNLIGDG